MNNHIAVSVCISVHNTERYLPRCLDSVIAQTIESLEIVLVNNGSTDSSEALMHKYKQQHPERCFVIITQEDRSLAGGRIAGIQHATGDFITFLDADDFVYPEAYQKMYDVAKENNADIVEVQTEREGVVISSPYQGLHEAHDVLRDYFVGNGMPSMLWLRMYRRNLFEKPVLPQLYTNNEDMFGLPCLLHAANTIYFLKETLHVYSTDNETAVMSNLKKKKGEKYFQSRSVALNILPFIEDYIGEKAINEEYKETFPKYKSRMLLGFLFYRFSDINYERRIAAVCPIVGASSVNDAEQIIKKTANNEGIGKLIKLIGVKQTFRLYKILKRV